MWNQCTDHCKRLHEKSQKKTVKEKSKIVSPSKTKNPKPKNNKVLGDGPLVSGTKSFSQNPNPRLKIDLKLKVKEKKPIPPLSDAKGVLGTGPAHLKFKDFLAVNEPNEHERRLVRVRSFNLTEQTNEHERA
ncbi:hypothetical protein OSB04_006780 [Centaurea solstitialis]|uniref:Uncharacterized protein n=1 Tax=Centaurea solstitialis TaxID=347529 RepID=A0AA38WQH0_9ASTR|nr:hypothetical protein OSB04_006780 [Centaurea solstitialis]